MAADTVQEIKQKLSIEAIISPYVKLKRAGRSMVGLCPFHKEKTPSFHVSPERGTWHCFGCGEGGDGFSFIERIEGVDFKGALKILAEKAGVPLVFNGNREDTSKKDRLRDAMSRAAAQYARRLAGGPGEAYAHARGLSDKTIEAWGIGYAPADWRTLLESLSAEGFTMQELLAAGLVKEAEGKPGTYYDRFRNRLMFPIRDIAGRTVAFTGRTLSADEQAKYLNSPETDLYHKSEILFGLDQAKEAIRTRGFACLVEGQLDVILAHQAGFTNAIALSGTALTEQHLTLLKRYSDNLMLVLDADSAGLRATLRAALLALRAGMRVKAVALPSGKDPADLVIEDPKIFAKHLAEAKPIVEFFLARLAEDESDPHRLVRSAEAVVLPLIAAMPSPMERDHFVQVTARALGLSDEALRAALARVPRNPEAVAPATPAQAAPAARSAREARAEQLLALVHAYPDTPLAERVESGYCRITEASKLPPEVPPESVVFSIEQTFGEEPTEDAADELLRAFEEAVVREAYQDAVQQLRKAEATGDAALIDEAQSRCATLSTRLAALGG